MCAAPRERSSPRIALSTTVYPGVEPFLADWGASVRAQTDGAFDIWIASDGLARETALEHTGPLEIAGWTDAGEDGPLMMRQRAFAALTEKYDVIVFTDADDMLLSDRIAAVRQSLTRGDGQAWDVYACALRIINEDGADAGFDFGPASTTDAVAQLPRTNVFGLSNTAYTSAALRKCLPLPAECKLLDWRLATHLWACDARFHFDLACRMKYRQYGRNTAAVVPPFTPQQIVKAAQLVTQHYACVLRYTPQLAAGKLTAIKEAQARALLFEKFTRNGSRQLNRYIEAINQLPPRRAWWDIIAHPALEQIWKT